MGRVLSVKVCGGEAYVTYSDGSSCVVSRFRRGSLEPLVSFKEPSCLILVCRGDLLVSAGNSLYLVSGNDAKLLLAAKPGNWFWHAVATRSGVYVQEYGEPPTGIYFSEDLKSFVRLVTNTEIDPSSRHFHYIAYDEQRGLLIATLGDGNVVRVAVSGDGGRGWRALYRGPWQFVPVLVEGGRYVFGFDSGIARGGVGVYEDGRFRFIFLKPRVGGFAQFTDLRRVGDTYVGVLGAPTAVIVSRDLRTWYPLHVDANSTGYNHFASVDVLEDRVVATTGSGLLSFSGRDVEEAFRREPFLSPYRALWDRARGFGFLLRRLPWLW
ncbi:hypothetical protein [Infirmifilum sp.]|uniref:hypothetical protein n=1 Tax=Infirmifilum sp. TaxID=2856575 RepID=UPI003D0B3C97